MLLSGWRLALASAGLFLGPIVLATIGAMVYGPDPGQRFVGALAGLGTGFLLSIWLFRKYQPTTEGHAGNGGRRAPGRGSQ